MDSEKCSFCYEDYDPCFEVGRSEEVSKSIRDFSLALYRAAELSMFIAGFCCCLNVYADTNKCLTNFVNKQKQTGLETLLACEEAGIEACGRKKVPWPGDGRGNESTNKQPTTLENFINTFCDLSRKPVVESKVELLFKYNRKELIILPPLATAWRPGQPKMFFAEDLTGKWRDFQKTIPTLPPLKNQ